MVVMLILVTEHSSLESMGIENVGRLFLIINRRSINIQQIKSELHLFTVHIMWMTDWTYTIPRSRKPFNWHHNSVKQNELQFISCIEYLWFVTATSRINDNTRD